MWRYWTLLLHNFEHYIVTLTPFCLFHPSYLYIFTYLKKKKCISISLNGPVRCIALYEVAGTLSLGNGSIIYLLESESKLKGYVILFCFFFYGCNLKKKQWWDLVCIFFGREIVINKEWQSQRRMFLSLMRLFWLYSVEFVFSLSSTILLSVCVDHCLVTPATVTNSSSLPLGIDTQV